MKKIFSASIAFFLIFSLTSCAIVWNGKPSTESTGIYSAETLPVSATETDEEISYLDSLRTEDMGGKTVVIASANAQLFAPSDSGVMKNAISARTQAIENKYNCNIAVSARTGDQIFDDLSAAVSSGLYYADLISVPLYDYGRFVENGLIVPLSDYADIKTDSPYYRTDDAFTQKNLTYSVISAACPWYDDTYCVYFDMKAAQSAGYDLYSLADAGKWTWDTLCSYANSPSFTGISVSSYEELVNCVFTSCGMKYTKYDGVSRTCDYTGDKLDRVRAICSDVIDGGYSVTGDGTGFSSGECLFRIGTLSEMTQYGSMADSFGILPLPVYTEGEKYASYVGDTAQALCIPKNAGVSAGILYEALSAASYGKIGSAYDIAAVSRSLRDNRAGLELSVIRESAATDYAYLFGRHYDAVANPTYWGMQYSLVNGGVFSQIYDQYRPDLLTFAN